jgi:hypothetical protein
MPKPNPEKYIGDSASIKAHYEKWKIIKASSKEQEAYLKKIRGYELEYLIYSVLYNESLNPSTGYKPDGEQIDGSFTYTHLPFLLEAKWHAKPTEASKIYAFKGKVDGKFHLTSGIFISMSGFSEDAPEALTNGKTSNVILFDGQDFEDIFLGIYSFTETFRFKFDKASFYGELYVPYRTNNIAKDSEKTIKPIIVAQQKQSTPPNEKKILILSPEQKLLNPFIENTLTKQKLPDNLKFLQMAFISHNPATSATLKHIHRMLFSLTDFNSYSGLIILYPIKDATFKFDMEDLNNFNTQLFNAGMNNGAVALNIDESGILNPTITEMINNYLVRIVNPNPLF